MRLGPGSPTAVFWSNVGPLSAMTHGSVIACTLPAGTVTTSDDVSAPPTTVTVTSLVCGFDTATA